MRPSHLFPIVILLLMALVLSPGAGLAQEVNYQQIVTRALSDLGANCANLGVNSVCVGFDQVQVTFTGATPEGFSNAPGDRAELTTVSSVQTQPVNLDDATLGIAVMYVKTTNVPGALTDQSAMFMLIGDAEINNAVAAEVAFVPGEPVAVTTIAEAALRNAPGADALLLGTVANGTLLQADAVSPGAAWVRVMYEDQIAWVSRQALDPDAGIGVLPVVTRDSRTPMQAFTFRTGSAPPPSLDVPPDVILVQSPKDIPVDIWANETHIRVEGVIFLRSLADGRIQLITSHGEATVFPETPQQVSVVAGTSIIIGAENWTEWRVVSQQEWDDSYDLFEKIPGNIITYEIKLPDIIIKSAIVPGETVVEVWDEGEVIIPIPPPPPTFPTVLATYGEPGQDLERLAWEPFEIGCAVCPAELVIYHSDSDDDWDIYRLVDDGMSEPANNISRGDGSQDLMPSYSADAQWVAYTTNRHVLGGWEIQVSRFDGAQDARVSFNSGNDVNPVWGPANLIAWETNRHGNWDLYMIDVAGDGTRVRLTDDAANDINPYWFPDGGCDQPEGGRLVFQSDRDGDWEIYELDVFSMELTKLTDNDTEDEMPVLSRDGSMLAWLQLDEFGVYNLWVMDLGTMEARQFTDLGTDVASHMFSPDDALVAFDANVDGDYEVYAVYLSSGAIVPVTDNSAEDRAPTFRCDDPMQVIYHSDAAADTDNPGQRELFESRVPVEGGTVNPPTRLTMDVEADEVYAEADAHEERASKEGRKPAHP
jgi:Tol biopolymer transport system component